MSLPNKDQILKFLEHAGTALSKRDICTAFKIKGEAQRIVLKNMLREMEDEGLLIREDGKSYKIADALPTVCVVEITEIDIDGDLLATPADWQSDVQGSAPRIEIIPERKGHHTLIAGDRALVRVRKVDDNLYEAAVLKKVDAVKARVVGFIKQIKSGYILSPIDRRAKHDFDIPSTELNGAQPDQIVVADILPSRSELRKKVRVSESVLPMTRKPYHLWRYTNPVFVRFFLNRLLNQLPIWLFRLLGNVQICVIFHWSQLMVKMRATLTMRCLPNLIPTLKTKVDTISSWRLQMWPITCVRAHHWTRKPICAETQHIFQTAFCQCCRKNSRMICARYVRMNHVQHWPHICGLMRMENSYVINLYVA